jgi:hypothetical protein
MTEQKVFSWISKITFALTIIAIIFLFYIRSSSNSTVSGALAQITLLFGFLVAFIAYSVSKCSNMEKTIRNTITLNIFRVLFYILSISLVYVLLADIFK